MVQDDQGTESAEWRREGDDPAMHRPHRRTFGGADLDAVSRDRRAESPIDSGTEAGQDGTADGPVEGSAKRLERKVRRRRSHSPDRSLQCGLRLLELGNVSRGEVAPDVEAVDCRVTGAHRLVELGPGLRRGPLRGADLIPLRFELVERQTLGLQRATVGVQAHLVERRDQATPRVRRPNARGSSDDSSRRAYPPRPRL